MAANVIVKGAGKALRNSGLNHPPAQRLILDPTRKGSAMTAPAPRPNPENKLGESTSPYLLQHRHNPVNWRIWGEDALAEAKRDNKPILLSVGYAACHWCHVMAHESFEDDGIAGLMNKLFVNIKIDREERPDLDTIYQQALALLG